MPAFARLLLVLSCTVATSVASALLCPAPARAAVTREEVERALREGVRYLKDQQRDDGSWASTERDEGDDGTTSLVTLALLTAGERPDSPEMARALEFLRAPRPDQPRRTYAVALQTLALAASDPDRHRVKIAANVQWLEEAQIKEGDHVNWPGAWTYSALKAHRGDNSNSQYALLALSAASEAGVPVKPEVWALARTYWERTQRRDGGWPYIADSPKPRSTASMTCAGISSLILTGLRGFQAQEVLDGETVRNCGKGVIHPNLQRGIDWMGSHFTVNENVGNGMGWRYYYLYGLERAGRLTGKRFFGGYDWYRVGAERLVQDQDKLEGFWKGARPAEHDPLVATSFAVLFLAKGRAPVLVNKLRHGPDGDWSNDHDDIRNLVGLTSRDWKELLTWQVVDPSLATVEELISAPIAFLNGHEAPQLGDAGEKVLRDFVAQGGFLLAEACCGRKEFDLGFRALMERLFPGQLHELGADHLVWRTRHRLAPEIHSLWGIESGCRTVVIYSPGDLSCYWNQMDNSSASPAVILAQRLGQNIVDYATGRELPADKLTVPDVKVLRPENPNRGALGIAKLRHGGDWNVAPLAIPNLMDILRKPPLNFDVELNHKELIPTDPALVNYPLVYLHGRAAFAFKPEEMSALRRHLEPGGGTLFADAACGSPAFDAAFRKFAAELLPGNPLVSIPRDDALYTRKIGFDLADAQYTKAAGGGRDVPRLEGIKLGGHWAVIYSEYDLGCALERHQGPDCQGYTYESALRIAANVVIYATLP